MGRRIQELVGKITWRRESVRPRVPAALPDQASWLSRAFELALLLLVALEDLDRERVRQFGFGVSTTGAGTRRRDDRGRGRLDRFTRRPPPLLRRSTGGGVTAFAPRSFDRTSAVLAPSVLIESGSP